MTPAELTDFLHRNIPLTAAMGLRTLHCAEGEIEIGAPLMDNRNHRGTAFGGSLATLGIVSAWALLHLSLRRAALDARLVIQKSECDYSAPVDRDFRAQSRLSANEIDVFLGALRQRRRARIGVDTHIDCGGLAAVLHRGTYVALL